jgi:hypothetical protein
MCAALVSVAVATGAAAASSTSTRATTTTARLLVSSAPDRSHAAPLAGHSIYGPTYIFLGGISANATVRFFLDGHLRSTRSRPPFDLAGVDRAGAARPFDPTLLSDGNHLLVATVASRKNVDQVIRATFDVKRWFVSPSGSDSGRCTRTSPCQSFARAFKAAPSGAAIEVASGDYGCAPVTGAKTATVTFVAARGAAPTTTCALEVDATHIAFRNLHLAGLRMAQTASYITLRNVDITCKDEAPFTLWEGHCSAGVFGAPSNFAMYGGSVGPTWDNASGSAPGNSQIGIPYEGGPYEARNILFDGVRFHDNRLADPGAHSECLMLGGGNGVTIRNSKFDHCKIFDIFVTWWNFVSPQYPAPSNILLENNWFFDTLDHNYSILFTDYPTAYTNVTVRYNSFTGTLGIDRGVPLTNFNVIGNVGPLRGFSCTPGVSYAYNVWDGTKCSSTDRQAPSGYVNASSYDLRLKRNAAAINHGDPRDFPKRDIFGHRRPRGRLPDAGAVETR